MPKDRNGVELNPGDRVYLPCEVVSLGRSFLSVRTESDEFTVLASEVVKGPTPSPPPTPAAGGGA